MLPEYQEAPEDGGAETTYTAACELVPERVNLPTASELPAAACMVMHAEEIYQLRPVLTGMLR